MIKQTIAILLFSSLTIGAFAQSHNEHNNQIGKDRVMPRASIEFNQAMDKMHGPMMIGIQDENADRAFVKGMIPHHVGAVDMAHTVIKYGKDPEVRKLAEDIIKAQEKEIKWMQDWLEKHPAE